MLRERSHTVRTASNSELTILSCKFLLGAKHRHLEGPCLSREAQCKHCKPNRTDPLLLSNLLRSGGLLHAILNSRVLSPFYSKTVSLKPEILKIFSPTSPVVHQYPNAMFYQVTDAFLVCLLGVCADQALEVYRDAHV